MKAKLISLSHLSNLEFFEAERLNLDANSFSNLANLKKLVLIECDFSEFRNDSSFASLRNSLKMLEIVAPINYAHLNFRSLSRLSLLKLSKIDHFAILEHLNDNLQVIQLVDSLDETKCYNFYSYLKHSGLQAVDLSYQNISHFDARWLSGLDQLSHLRLVVCKVSYSFILVKFEMYGGVSICVKRKKKEKIEKNTCLYRPKPSLVNTRSYGHNPLSYLPI